MELLLLPPNRQPLLILNTIPSSRSLAQKSIMSGVNMMALTIKSGQEITGDTINFFLNRKMPIYLMTKSMLLGMVRQALPVPPLQPLLYKFIIIRVLYGKI